MNAGAATAMWFITGLIVGKASGISISFDEFLSIFGGADGLCLVIFINLIFFIVLVWIVNMLPYWQHRYYKHLASKSREEELHD